MHRSLVVLLLLTLGLWALLSVWLEERATRLGYDVYELHVRKDSLVRIRDNLSGEARRLRSFGRLSEKLEVLDPESQSFEALQLGRIVPLSSERTPVFETEPPANLSTPGRPGGID